MARLHGMNDPYYTPGLDMPWYNSKKKKQEYDDYDDYDNKWKWRKDETYDDYDDEDEGFDNWKSKNRKGK